MRTDHETLLQVWVLCDSLREDLEVLRPETETGDEWDNYLDALATVAGIWALLEPLTQPEKPDGRF